MIKLSANFTLEEMYKSPTADKLNIDNTPNEEVITNLKNLVVNLLQPLRDKVNLPIKINSGYRCQELNKAVKGALNSDHTKGFAADIVIHGVDNKELFEFIRDNFKFSKMILEFYDASNPEGSWLHISYNPKELNRYCYIAKKDSSGKTIYVPCV